jgi:hypothetical protein
VPLVGAKLSTDIPDKLVLGADETDKDLAARLPTPDLAWIERIVFPSALVDVTNFFTFDCNRPLHVFDADKLSGGMTVHLSAGGESFVGLNERTYTLEPGMCVISDASGVVSLGGPFPLEESLFASLADVRRLPMLLCCGRDVVAASPAHTDRMLRLFHAAGASLAMRIYPDHDDLSRPVLADVNRWIMDEVCGTPAAEPSLSAS